MNFTELGLKQEIVDALKQQGIVEPTTIQQKAIPLIKDGKDVVGMSRTGSGKTATFGVPLLHNLDPNGGLQYLIVAPIRELAVQIANELKKFGKLLKFNVTTVFGGLAINPQMEAISRANIVVGTPGRLMDHLQRRTLDLSKIKTIVLDEADKMVEMGFIEDIEYIINQANEYRQILLFGATISSEIDHLKKKYMNDPVIAEGETHVEDDFLKQYYYNVRHNEKFSLLIHLLKKENIKKAIIFCSARSTVELLTKNLRKQGLSVDMIHGKLSQNKRLKVMDEFNKDKTDLLVASAVAARGLDIKFLTHVFNYDLSQDPQEYVHRVGRTARAGESGKAITLLSEKDFGTFNDILTRYRHINVEEMPDEKFERIRFDATRNDSRSHSRGTNNYSKSWDKRGSQGRGRSSGGSSSSGSRNLGVGHRSSNSGDGDWRSQGNSTRRQPRNNDRSYGRR
jgi:superfamily II DNA/RNA helicase